MFTSAAQSPVESQDIFEIQGGVLKRCLDKNVSMSRIPRGVKRINPGSFRDCKLLEVVEITDGVNDIGEHAFSNCENLKFLVMPVSLKRIGNWVFKNCKHLESVIIPDSVEEIGEWAFAWCTNLKTLVLPTSLKRTGFATFIGCGALEKIFVNKSDVDRIKGLLPDGLRSKVHGVPEEVHKALRALDAKHHSRVVATQSGLCFYYRRLLDYINKDLRFTKLPIQLDFKIGEYLGEEGTAALSCTHKAEAILAKTLARIKHPDVPKPPMSPLLFVSVKDYEDAMALYAREVLTFLKKPEPTIDTRRPALVHAGAGASEVGAASHTFLQNSMVFYRMLMLGLHRKYLRFPSYQKYCREKSQR